MAYIQLHKKNLFHNLDYFSQSCGSKEKVCTVLKDNAYGHGLDLMASMVKEYGIKHVCVRNLSEAQIVNKYHFESVLVFYDMPTKKDDSIVVSINSLYHLEKVPNGSKIELKIDSGMHRNGIDTDQIEDAIELIRKKSLILHGVFTHFCCSDEENIMTKNQEKLFLKVVEEIKTYIAYKFRIHCANSAGVFKVDMARYDIARVGLGTYGYVDLPQEKNLKPVLSLHANKITTKNIDKGDNVGYGSNSFIAQKPMCVSNYDVGYADGLIRANSHKKRFIANGLEILGRVSMDSFSVESQEDEVCVFDNATHFAQVHNTIRYEILTNLKPNIKKVIV
jgi:alanine racemase